MKDASFPVSTRFETLLLQESKRTLCQNDFRNTGWHRNRVEIFKRKFQRMGITLKRSRLDGGKTRRLLEHFVAGTTARTAAELVGVNRNTATRIYHRLRTLIAERLARVDAHSTTGDAIGDEIYLYGAGKTGTSQSSSNDAAVFGLYSCRGRIRILIVPKIQRDTLLELLKTPSGRTATLFTDDTMVSEALRSFGLRHRHISGHNRFAPGSHRVNRMENFWNQARRHLRRYNGIPGHHLHLYLKECEWRFNYGSPRELRMTLTQWIREDR
jgi:transposase